MNILIVEDDSDMQKILKLYLQREGYQVNSVSNGRDAIDFLIVNAVDIVLLDWMMPIKKRNGNAERNQAVEYSG